MLVRYGTWSVRPCTVCIQTFGTTPGRSGCAWRTPLVVGWIVGVICQRLRYEFQSKVVSRCLDTADSMVRRVNNNDTQASRKAATCFVRVEMRFIDSKTNIISVPS